MGQVLNDYLESEYIHYLITLTKKINLIINSISKVYVQSIITAEQETYKEIQLHSQFEI